MYKCINSCVYTIPHYQFGLEYVSTDVYPTSFELLRYDLCV